MLSINNKEQGVIMKKILIPIIAIMIIATSFYSGIYWTNLQIKNKSTQVEAIKSIFHSKLKVCLPAYWKNHLKVQGLKDKKSNLILKFKANP